VLIRPRRGNDLATCADLVREVNAADRYPRYLPPDIGAFLAACTRSSTLTPNSARPSRCTSRPAGPAPGRSPCASATATSWTSTSTSAPAR